MNIPVVAIVDCQACRFPLESMVQELVGLFQEAELKELVGDLRPGVGELVPEGAVVGLNAHGRLHVAEPGRPLAISQVEPHGLPVDRAQCQVRPADVELRAYIFWFVFGQRLAGGEGLVKFFSASSNRPRSPRTCPTRILAGREVSPVLSVRDLP